MFDRDGTIDLYPRGDHYVSLTSTQDLIQASWRAVPITDVKWKMPISQAHQIAVTGNPYLSTEQKRSFVDLHDSIQRQCNALFFNRYKSRRSVVLGDGHIIHSGPEHYQQLVHCDLLPNLEKQGFVLFYPFACTKTLFIPKTSSEWYGPTPPSHLDYTQNENNVFIRQDARTAIWARGQYFVQHPETAYNALVRTSVPAGTLSIFEHDLLHAGPGPEDASCRFALFYTYYFEHQAYILNQQFHPFHFMHSCEKMDTNMMERWRDTVGYDLTDHDTYDGIEDDDLTI